ncbi:hypothetical protein V6Z11_A13G083900 [Gossypium hirsutum]
MSNGASAVSVIFDSVSGSKGFILYKSLQKDLKMLEFLSNLVIVMNGKAVVTIQQFLHLTKLPKQYCPRKAYLSNIDCLKLLVQIPNQLHCWFSFSRPLFE